MSNENGSKALQPPAKLEEDRKLRANESMGFADILKYVALGMAPTAPRLPDQAGNVGSMFGGYPKGFTNKMGPKGTLGFSTLRQVAQRSPVLAAIVSRRMHQAVRHARLAQRTKKGQVGFRVGHKRSGEKDFKVDEGFKNLAREAEQMIMKPWRVFWNDDVVYSDIEPTFAGFMSKITHDLLIINRPVIELGLDPLKIPRAFGAIDGANVIPTFAAMKYLTSVNKEMPKDFVASNSRFRHAMQLASDKYKVDLDERTEYIYLQDGKPLAGYRNGELIIAPQFPVTDVKYAGYPPSLTEQSVFIILSEIMAMASNAKYFEYGQMAETIIALKGNQNDQHVTALLDILKNNMTGIQGMHRLPVIATPGGKDDIDVIPMKTNHKDMLFDVYIQKLTNLACAVFSMHPSEINEAPRAGDNGGGLNQAGQTKQINMAQEQGLEAMLEHIKSSIMDPLLERIDPDLTFEWDFGQNEQEKLQIVTSYGAITTVNERRAMMELDPLSEEEGGNVVDNQYIQSRNQLQQQQEQAQAQAAQAGGDAGGGAAGGPSGKPEPEGGDETDQPDDEEDNEKPGEPDYESESVQDRVKRLLGSGNSKKKT